MKCTTNSCFECITNVPTSEYPLHWKNYESLLFSIVIESAYFSSFERISRSTHIRHRVISWKLVSNYIRICILSHVEFVNKLDPKHRNYKIKPLMNWARNPLNFDFCFQLETLSLTIFIWKENTFKVWKQKTFIVFSV